MDRLVLRHVTGCVQVGNIIAFGQRCLDESVIRTLGCIECYGVRSMRQTHRCFDRFTRLLVVDIHTEGVDNRSRDTFHFQTEGIKRELLYVLHDGIRRIIAVLGGRNDVLTRRQTTLNHTLFVGVLLLGLTRLPTGDFHRHTAQRVVRSIVEHLNTHTRIRFLRIILRRFLMTRQIEPYG